MPKLAMRIKIDEKKLAELMEQRGIKTYRELAEVCGIPLGTIYTSRSIHNAASKETLWLISEGLNCSINDFVYPDWNDGA